MTIITDVKPNQVVTSREDSNDLIQNLLFLQGLHKDFKKYQEEFAEGQSSEGDVPTSSSTVASSSVASNTTEAASTTDEEVETDGVYYAEAMIAAMSAVSQNLSNIIDKSSERSVLLKDLADAAIKQAQANLKDTIDTIHENRRLEKEAEKKSFWGRVIGYAIFAVTMVASAVLFCVPGMQAVAVAMAVIAVTILILDETGQTEKIINGLTEMVLWIDQSCGFDNLSEEDAMYVAMAIYFTLQVIVSVGLPFALAKVAVAVGLIVSTGALVSASATANAAKASTQASYILVSNSVEEAARGAYMAAEAGEAVALSATKASLEATNRAAQLTAQAANYTAAGLTQQAQAASKLAESFTRAAQNATQAANNARTAAQTARQAADDAIAAAMTLKNASGGADMAALSDDAVRAAEAASAAANSVQTAVEAAMQAVMVIELLKMGGRCTQAAQTMLSTADEVALVAKTDDLVDVLQSIMRCPAARYTFGKLSKVMNPEYAARIIHFISQHSLFENLVRLEMTLTLAQAGVTAATGAVYVELSKAREEMGKNEAEKSIIMDSSQAIDVQRNNEDAFFAMIHKAMSDILNNMKTTLAREWRSVTVAIQG